MKRKLGVLVLLCSIMWNFAALAGYDEGVEAYFTGRYQKAWLELGPLAAGDDVYAQLYVGLMYYRGRGVTRDYAAARRWLQRPAQYGIGSAPTVLGRLYERGLGGVRDYAVAASWYRRAAQGGSAVAQYKLGILYRDGHGVERSPDRAIVWLRRAAEQGSVAAQAALGGILEGAADGPERAEAQWWYSQARRQGFNDRARNLFDM